VHAINEDFNPRFWIYLIRTGMEAELLRDKDIIWQCVSCNKCTYACPRDVFPEGVMKATAHWLELKGHTPKSHSTIFDDVFTEQVVARGKIEDGRTMRRYFSRTGQALMQSWVVRLVKGMLRNLPIGMLAKMGLGTFVAPRTSNWSDARDAINEHIQELDSHHRLALGLDELVSMAEQELSPKQAD
jgi:heterodisulfide reductase subunit C